MASTNKTTPRILVLGSLNMDLVSYVPHHPSPGETLTSTRFNVSGGGKGANQAVACAKLSRACPTNNNNTAPGGDVAAAAAAATVQMVGCVGDDSYGTALISNLSDRYGVDCTGVLRRSDLKTGVALIIVDEPTGQNRIILSPEANHAGMGPEETMDRLEDDLRGGGGGVDLLIMQLEIPLPTVLSALALAKDSRVPVLLNPAPAVPLPASALRGLDHLVVNETEAAILSGCDVSELDTEDGLRRVADRFIGSGVGNVVITLGERGVYYMSSSSPKHNNSGGAKMGLVAAEKVQKVVDTTAAGDTFVGQYALEVVTGQKKKDGDGDGGGVDVETAVRKANKAAAKTVQKLGAQDSIPWRDEL
ncbi:Ribokinase-like protein [Diplogelasinospora grovesii]|uniref:Ribokinase n=1 Tax=Diplogelasinospora grovesii TaxID=303347 RepID=A0AAN6NGZ3_9PEZI|nr:Ribokinase-like protein [Diplogelasinospora grovesii]